MFLKSLLLSLLTLLLGISHTSANFSITKKEQKSIHSEYRTEKKEILLSFIRSLKEEKIVCGFYSEKEEQKKCLQEKVPPLVREYQKQKKSLQTRMGKQKEDVLLGQSIFLEKSEKKEKKSSIKNIYEVLDVVDGGTIKIDYNGKRESIRMIGIDTPEKYATRTGYEECYGKEASDFAESLLEGKKVQIEFDKSQNIRDKYGRLLTHVFLEDGRNYQETALLNGFGFHYIYKTPSEYSIPYSRAQEIAKIKNIGVWKHCDGKRKPLDEEDKKISEKTKKYSSKTCDIKANINSKGDKIYHFPGCKSYNQTNIDESKGEHFFCSEKEALEAGWRRARNCE